MVISRPRATALALVAIVVFSTTFPAVGVAAAQTTTGDVSAWENAGLPLRADGVNAATTITNPSVSVNEQGSESPPISKDVYVYNQGDRVDLGFGGTAGIDTSQFNGDAQVVVMRLNADMQTQTAGGNTSLNDLTGVSAVTDLVREEINQSSGTQDNATVVAVENVTIASDGTFSTSVTPTETGEYVAVTATGRTFSQSGDSLTMSGGDTTLVGTDTFSVQSEPSEVTAPNLVAPGENASFTVGTGGDIPDANHTVVLYDANTYEEQEFTLVLDDDRNDLQTDEITINHTLDTVDARTRVDSGISFMGMGIGETVPILDVEIPESASRSIDLPSAIDRALADADERTGGDFSAIETQPSNSQQDVLRVAAAGTTETNGQTTVDVPTGADWSGEYRWVHVASDGDQMETETGTLQVGTDSSPPSVDITPANGTAYPAGTEEVEFTVTYGDDQSGVPVPGGVDLSFEGISLTTTDANIGANQATYTATGEILDAGELEDGTDYTFSATVTNGEDLSASESVTVSINSSGGGGGGGVGGGIGGGIGGGDDGGVDLPVDDGEGEGPVDAPVEPTPGTPGATVSVDVGDGGGEFRANFSGTDLAEPDEEGVALEELSGTVSNDGSLTVTRGQGENVPAISEDTNAVLSYLNVQEDQGTDASSATFTFTVQKSTLEQRGLAADDVSLYRYNSGQWAELDTTRVAERPDRHRYQAQSPGFSTFAVAQRGLAQQETTTTTTEDTTTTTEESGPEEPGPAGGMTWLWAIVVLLVIAGAGGYLAYHRGYFDEALGAESDESDEGGAETAEDGSELGGDGSETDDTTLFDESPSPDAEGDAAEEDLTDAEGEGPGEDITDADDEK